MLPIGPTLLTYIGFRIVYILSYFLWLTNSTLALIAE